MCIFSNIFDLTHCIWRERCRFSEHETMSLVFFLMSGIYISQIFTIYLWNFTRTVLGSNSFIQKSSIFSRDYVYEVWVSPIVNYLSSAVELQVRSSTRSVQSKVNWDGPGVQGVPEKCPLFSNDSDRMGTFFLGHPVDIKITFPPHPPADNFYCWK